MKQLPFANRLRIHSQNRRSADRRAKRQRWSFAKSRATFRSESLNASYRETIAFSGKVATGFPSGNASNQEPGAGHRFHDQLNGSNPVTRYARVILLGAGLTLAVPIAFVFAEAAAQPGPQAPVPMPPLRPPGIGTAPKPAPSADDAGRPRSAPKQKSPGSAPPHPLTAPGPMTNRRQAIYACIKEWRSLQRADLTGDMLWRDFSRACIGRQMKPDR